MSVRTETIDGPLVGVYPDGSHLVWRQTVIIVEDWRDTVLGPMDFGYRRMLPGEQIRIPPPAVEKK